MRISSGKLKRPEILHGYWELKLLGVDPATRRGGFATSHIPQGSRLLGEVPLKVPM